MQLVKPFHDKQYYEAYLSDKLIGTYPEANRDSQLSFRDWQDDMVSIATHGFSIMEHKARQARLQFMQANPKANGEALKLANFMPVDTRRRYN